MDRPARPRKGRAGRVWGTEIAPDGGERTRISEPNRPVLTTAPKGS